MSTLGYLILVLILAYGIWPYYHLYALDRAVIANDREALERLVDIDSVRAEAKRSLVGDVDDSGNLISGWLLDGVQRLGRQAVDSMVNLDWVRNILSRTDVTTNTSPGFIRNVSYAFFERPTQFLVRIGELGQHPVHVRLQFRHWSWRVTAVYE